MTLGTPIPRRHFWYQAGLLSSMAPLLLNPCVARSESIAMKRRVKLDGLELDCEIRGTGEPVVLVHAGLFADWFTPVVDQAALRPYQVVSFHRAGYAGSSRVEGPLSIAQQAAYVRALMMHLGVEDSRSSPFS
jgi:pimeloyl-ACP methyl ester carboxylesterase